MPNSFLAKQGAYTMDRPLLPQLAAIGYTPADITYLALLHYHGDRVANARLFAGSTSIIQQADRDAIFGPRPSGQKKLGGVGDPAYFAAQRAVRPRPCFERGGT